ncbi:MAG: hypothetical protein MI866_21425 [Bacteroidales bacterium]|nr:hypothetical protein [Bacteroidales bacterium]
MNGHQSVSCGALLLNKVGIEWFLAFIAGLQFAMGNLLIICSVEASWIRMGWKAYEIRHMPSDIGD